MTGTINLSTQTEFKIAIFQKSVLN